MNEPIRKCSWLAAIVLLACPPAAHAGDTPGRPQSQANRPLRDIPADPPATPKPAATAPTPAAAPTVKLPLLPSQEAVRSAQSVLIFAAMSFAPAAVLMLTGFIRIQIVLTLLRQALGSPQVPGNQVLSALALLLTFLVMAPVGERIYARAIEPYQAGTISAQDAWREGSGPLKRFMIGQIHRSNHDDYLATLYDHAVPRTPGRFEPEFSDEYPFHVVASAFVLSELTTALFIGFVIYLPFLVVDLVVSAVLSAMGLFMLPPTLVALPLKLILFALANGWLLVATTLLETFQV